MAAGLLRTWLSQQRLLCVRLIALPAESVEPRRVVRHDEVVLHEAEATAPLARRLRLALAGLGQLLPTVAPGCDRAVEIGPQDNFHPNRTEQPIARIRE